MRYLTKNPASTILTQGWKYACRSHRPLIRQALLNEQNQYCAYSEKWIGDPLDSKEIEHYYPKIDYPDHDHYFYWYLVCRTINGNKARKIEGTKDGKTPTHLPLPEPFDPTLPERIAYDGSVFYAKNANDIKAKNFLCWTEMNNDSLVEERKHKADRLLLDLTNRGIENKPDEIARYLADKPWLCEYASAIEFAYPGCLNQGTFGP